MNIDLKKLTKEDTNMAVKNHCASLQDASSSTSRTEIC